MNKLIVVILAAPLLFFSCKKTGVENIEGKIHFLSGDVNILVRGKERPAAAGDVIKGGMKIIVGERSSATIVVENSILSLGEKTTFDLTRVITNHDTGGRERDFFLNRGRVLVKVTAKIMKADRFNVTTPTAVAGVRGTEFLVSEETGKCTISCFEGNVEVKSAKADSAPVICKPGKMVRIVSGKKPKAVSLSRMDKADKKFVKSARITGSLIMALKEGGSGAEGQEQLSRMSQARREAHESSRKSLTRDAAGDSAPEQADGKSTEKKVRKKRKNIEEQESGLEKKSGALPGRRKARGKAGRTLSERGEGARESKKAPAETEKTREVNRGSRIETPQDSGKERPGVDVPQVK